MTSIHDLDPALMTLQEYLAVINSGNKFHDNDAYQIDLDHMNKGTGIYNINDYTKILKTIRRNGIYFQVRAKLIKLNYSLKDVNDVYIQDDNNQLIPMTDEEVKASNYEPFEKS